MALFLENEEVVATKYKTLFIKMIKQITIEMNTFEYCKVSVFEFLRENSKFM